MNLGWLSASPTATTGYGGQTLEVCDRLMERHEVVCIGQVGDVIVWGGRQKVDTPSGKKLEVVSLSDPGSAPNVINLYYVPEYKLDVIIGFMDAFGIEFMNNIKVPVIGWCITGDSLINTLLGLKPIEHIKVGELVYGYENGRTRLTRVTAKSLRLVHNYYNLQTGKESLKITGEHPVWFNGKYIPVKNLNIRNGYVLSLGENWHTTKGIQPKILDGGRSPALKDIGFNTYTTGNSEETKQNVTQCSVKDMQYGTFFTEGTKKTPSNLPFTMDSFRNRVGLPCRNRRWRGYNQHSLSQKEEQEAKWEDLLLSSTNDFYRKYFQRTSRMVKREIRDKGAYRNMENTTSFQLEEDQFSTKTMLSLAFNGIQNISYFGGNFGLPSHKEKTGRTNFRISGKPLEQKLRCTILKEGDRVSNTGAQFEPCYEQIIRLKRVICRPTLVYNIETDTSNYFANGILVHNCPIDGPFTSKWKNYVRNFHRVIAYSRFGYGELQKWFPPTKIGYIPHMISEDFKPLDKDEVREEFEEKYGISKDAFLAVNVGANVGPRKEIPLMMRTFKRFVEDGHEDSYLFIHTNAHGVFPRAYDLPIWRAMLGMEEHILFPHYNPIISPVSNSQLARVHTAGDIYWQNSVAEGFGLPEYEAMACGIPPICPRNSAQTEIVEGNGPKRGWLVENVPEDMYVQVPIYVPQLTNYPVPNQRSALEKLEEAYHSPDLREKYGRAAQAYIEKYHRADYCMKKWFRLLDEIEAEIEMLKTVGKAFEANAATSHPLSIE